MEFRKVGTSILQGVRKANFIAKKLPVFPKGLKIVHQADLTKTLSIGTYLEQNASKYPHYRAIVFEHVRYTHQELNENVNQYANYFLAQGIKKGDVIALFIDNRPELLMCVGAAAKIGAIVALINTNQRKNGLRYSFELVRPKVFVIGEEFVDAFEEVKEEVQREQGKFVFFLADSQHSVEPAGYVNLKTEIQESPKTNPLMTKIVMMQDPCFYIYTSGTTGLPKASVMSHHRWVKAGAGFGMLALGLQPTDTLYVPLPFYHNTALTVAWSSACVNGAAIAMRRKFSASQFWQDARKFHATAFCYIGEMCRYLMNQPVQAEERNHSIRKVMGNGLRPDIWKEFKQRFGIEEVYEFYAASEGNIAFVNIFNRDCTVGFCPAPYALVSYDVENEKPLRDSQGWMQKVKKGEVGLLLSEVSEKYSFDGYTNPSANEEKLFRDVFQKGDLWFNSGDLLLDQGFHHAQFVDRIGDTFRWKGENVSTNEVQEVINRFSQVAESTVYGVEITNTNGRAGMASLVLHRPIEEFAVSELATFLLSELPNYAIPVFLRIATKLEITGTFKHRKVELKQQGFDPVKVKDPMYVMLPKSHDYVAMTKNRFKEIQSGKILF